MATAIQAEDCDTVEKILEEVDSFLFDCDGVLWGSDEIFPGAAETLKKLHRRGKKVLFVTNNSTKSRSEYLKKIKGYGVEATLNEVYCTAYTCALYLKQNLGSDGEVYVVGNASIGQELDKVGIKHFGIGPDNSIKNAGEASKLGTEPMRKNVRAVVVGFDDHFNYAKITKAVSYLSKPGTLFVATNMDANFPVTDCEYMLPGTGAFITAVSYAAERKPDVICGKPDSVMIDCVKAECDFDPSKAIMVGDRLDTDILFGNKNGLKTLLVMSGVTNQKMLQELSQSNDSEAKKMMPKYYANSLADFGRCMK